MIQRHAFAIALALVLGIAVVVPSASAARHPGGGSTCVRKPPRIAVDNTYNWGAWGSWGTAGQQLLYAINVMNYDAGCRSSSFVVSVTAATGFSVSPTTSSVTLKPSSSRYIYANVTSPASAADGDYPLVVTVKRVGGAGEGSFTSYFKVYSSDTVAPTLYWPDPNDGVTIGGTSYSFGVSSRDDHAVKTIELYVDGTYRSTTVCDDVAYNCQMHAPTSVQGQGQHTATFKSYDWFGNIGTLTVGFTVG